MKTVKEILPELEAALKEIETLEEMRQVEKFAREHFNEDGSIIFDLTELEG